MFGIRTAYSDHFDKSVSRREDVELSLVNSHRPRIVGCQSDVYQTSINWVAK